MNEALRRKAVELAWTTGRLRYKLANRPMWLPPYDAIQAMPQKEEYVFECGRRTGKSSTMLLLCVEEALRTPHVQVGYMAPVREKLTEYMRPIIHDLIADCPPKLAPVYNEKSNKLIFPNGSEVLFVGSNNKSYITLRGFKLKFFAGDEIAFADDMGFAMEQVIRPALFDSQGKAVLGSSPPPSMDHVFIEIADAARLENRWFHATIYDAGYPLEWIEREKRKYLKGGKSDADWRREYMAERIVDPSRAVVPEWKNEYIKDITRDEFFPFYQYVCALDLGWSDLTAVLWMYWDFKRALLVVEDELILKGPSMTTELLVYQIRERESTLLGGKKVNNRVADVNNPLILSDMARMHNMAFNFPSKDRKEAMVNDLRMLVAKGGVAVNPRCKILIQTLKNAIWDEARSEFERSATTGHADALDALLYGARSINTYSNPIPPDYKLDGRTHFIPPTLKTGEQSAFQEAFRLRPAQTPLYKLRGAGRSTIWRP